ncbi:MAG: peptidylprolyl isomerase [Chloroflexota bacterium]
MIKVHFYRPLYFLIAGLWILFVLTGCTADGELTITPSPLSPDRTALPSALPTATATITPTPEPAALIVNNERISQREFEASLLQLQTADEELGNQRTDEERIRMVVEDLIEQTLLAQAARASGFTVSDEVLESRLQQIISEAGGQPAFEQWLSNMGYADETVFRSALRRGIEAANQRNRLAESVPQQIEQVKARQILVRQRSTADALYRQLQAGADFATLAFQYDPLTGGDLGWFPRGFLTVPAVEEAAFMLQAGEYSGVIESSFGYHIIYVEERDENHPLSGEARMKLQESVIEEWLTQQRAAAQIEILVP